MCIGKQFTPKLDISCCRALQSYHSAVTCNVVSLVLIAVSVSAAIDYIQLFIPRECRNTLHEIANKM